LDKPPRDFKPIPLHRIVQRRLTETVEAIHRIVPLDEVVHPRKVAVLRRSVQLLALKLCTESASGHILDNTGQLWPQPSE